MPWPAAPTAAVVPARRTTTILVVAVIAAFVVALVGALAFVTLKPGAAPSDPTIVAVMQANIDATNDEDIAAYMACLDPSSPAYESTRSSMTPLFATYRLHVELNEASVVDASATVAHVKFVMTTTRISGPAFQDNRLTGVMELHKVSGAWKIYGQTIQKIENL